MYTEWQLPREKRHASQNASSEKKLDLYKERILLGEVGQTYNSST